MNNELRIRNYYYWIRRFRILFLLGFTLNAYSQRASINLKSLPQLSNNPDSGLLVAQKWFLESYKNNDFSTQVLSLIEQSKLHYQLCEFDQAHVKLNQAILIANSTKNQDLILKSYLAKSDFYFNSIKKNSAFENHDLIVHLAKKSNDKTGFFFYLGNFYHNNTDSALHYYRLSLQSAKKKSTPEYLVNAYTLIGKVLINKKSVYPEGQKYLDSAIVICNQHNYQKHKALALFYFASSLLKQSIYDEALAQNIEAFEIRKKIKDCQNLASSYNSIANLHIKIGKSKESLKYYKEGVKHSEAHKNTLMLPTIYQNIGSAFNNINKDSAKFYLQKAINASKVIKDEHALAYATFNLADINADMGHYKKARAGMFEAMRIFEKIDETSNVGWVLPCIVQLDLKHFEEKKIAISQQQFNESNEMLKKALDLNANGNNYETLADIYDSYIRLGKLKGDYRFVAENQSKLLTLKDTVFKQQKLRIGIEMAEKLKTAEQKNKISQLELTNIKSASERNLTLILSGIFFVFGLIITIFYIKNLRRKNKLRLIQQQETFRNQVSSDLHDDVGTILSGLAMQAEMVSITSTNAEEKKSLAEISLMSREAMETMRDIVWAIDSRQDKYENLIGKMRDFAEKNLHLKHIKHSFKIEAEDTKKFIAPEKRQNIYLIFKEAITNISKHSDARNVAILFREEPNKIYLLIHDDGSTGTIKATDGLGLKNMRMRAKAINGLCEITFDNGFKVELTVPR